MLPSNISHCRCNHREHEAVAGQVVPEVDAFISYNIYKAHHGLEGIYLQRYLDEFCYRFNKWHSRKPLFDHLLVCSVWASYKAVADLYM